MIIDTDDMNKENIGVLDGTPLNLETNHYVVPRPLSDCLDSLDFYKSLHQKHISKPHKEFLDIDALIEFRNSNEDYCNEENSDKLLKERFGTKGAAIQAYIEKHNQGPASPLRRATSRRRSSPPLSFCRLCSCTI